jgi:hypothetical protein
MPIEAVATLRHLGFEVELANGLTLPDGTAQTVCWVRSGNESICLELDELEQLMEDVC